MHHVGPKFRFTHDEVRIIVMALIELKNQLISEGRYTDAVDNLLKEVRKDYDYILIDCMPSLGMLTINALTAADSVIIPVQAQYLPAKGMTQLLRSIDMIRSHTNEGLKIDGIVMTLVDGRTNLARDVINAIRTNYGMNIRIFDAQIPVAVRAAEASKTGMSLFKYDAQSKATKGYEALTKEVIADAERSRKRDKAAIACIMTDEVCKKIQLNARKLLLLTKNDCYKTWNSIQY